MSALRRALLGLTVLVLLAAAGLCIWLFHYTGDLPTTDQLSDFAPGVRSLATDSCLAGLSFAVPFEGIGKPFRAELAHPKALFRSRAIQYFREPRLLRPSVNRNRKCRGSLFSEKCPHSEYGRGGSPGRGIAIAGFLFAVQTSRYGTTETQPDSGSNGNSRATERSRTSEGKSVSRRHPIVRQYRNEPSASRRSQSACGR